MQHSAGEAAKQSSQVYSPVSVKIRLHPRGGCYALFALILRVYSYLYHLVLCLFLLGLQSSP